MDKNENNSDINIEENFKKQLIEEEYIKFIYFLY